MAAQIQDTADGPALTGIDVVLRENPDAWAGYSLELPVK